MESIVATMARLTKSVVLAKPINTIDCKIAPRIRIPTKVDADLNKEFSPVVFKISPSIDIFRGGDSLYALKSNNHWDLF